MDQKGIDTKREDFFMTSFNNAKFYIYTKQPHSLRDNAYTFVDYRYTM